MTTAPSAGKDGPRNDPAWLLERTRRGHGGGGPMLLQAHADAIQKCGVLSRSAGVAALNEARPAPATRG